MEKITSFTIDHNILRPGLYLSRRDRNTITYDLRTTVPNEYFMDGAAMHTVEHLAATFLRNSKIKDSIVYFGPMGCKTGFYLVIFDDVTPDTLLCELNSAFKFMAEFEGEIPGSAKEECGNYKYHDLEKAKKIAADYLAVLGNVDSGKLEYDS